MFEELVQWRMIGQSDIRHSDEKRHFFRRVSESEAILRLINSAVRHIGHRR
jgi:hypothetical protein